MADIEIISANVCPFAQRSRLALLEKGVDFRLTEIDLENKPDWFAAVSPYSKVPVLRHGGNRIYESAVINEYLEEAFPEPPLMPGDPGLRAQARIWIDFCNVRYVPTQYRLLLAQDEEKRTKLRDQLAEHLRFIEQEGLGTLSGDGPFWLGADISLVDLTYYPFLERFVALTHYRGMTMPDDCPKLKAWFAHMRNRPSVIETGNSDEFYIKHYIKYADGTANGVSARELKDD